MPILENLLEACTIVRGVEILGGRRGGTLGTLVVRGPRDNLLVFAFGSREKEGSEKGKGKGKGKGKASAKAKAKDIFTTTIAYKHPFRGFPNLEYHTHTFFAIHNAVTSAEISKGGGKARGQGKTELCPHMISKSVSFQSKAKGECPVPQLGPTLSKRNKGVNA